MLDEITRRVSEAVHADKIILFGSHAWGHPGPDSDIDLFVIVPDSDEPPHRRPRAIYRALRGLGVPVDLIVQTRDEVRRARRVATSLASKVFSDGRVLHG
ncbi:MAG: nucleotidyltransferase domain-containing protein [Gammaproteobacteria bacterium]|nr:MAG: nucleotidyltransferase domain-containing protein [Gammaproteobacteria bacterium]